MLRILSKNNSVVYFHLSKVEYISENEEMIAFSMDSGETLFFKKNADHISQLKDTNNADGLEWVPMNIEELVKRR